MKLHTVRTLAVIRPARSLAPLGGKCELQHRTMPLPSVLEPVLSSMMRMFGVSVKALGHFSKRAFMQAPRNGTTGTQSGVLLFWA